MFLRTLLDKDVTSKILLWRSCVSKITLSFSSDKQSDLIRYSLDIPQDISREGRNLEESWEPLEDSHALKTMYEYVAGGRSSRYPRARKLSQNPRKRPPLRQVVRSRRSLYDNIKEKLEVLEKEEERGMMELRGGWNFAGRQG